MTDVPTASRIELHDRLIGQAVEEYFSLEDDGELPDLDEFLNRYPQIADVLGTVIPALQVADEEAAVSTERRGFGRNSQIGDFRILRQIGRGGMGVVYEAVQISMSRRVALKVLPFAGLVDEAKIRRFQSEVRAAATLDHPNIVAAYTVGEERGIHYYAMQLIRGKNLAQVISSLREMKEGEGSLDALSISFAASGHDGSEPDRVVRDTESGHDTRIQGERDDDTKPENTKVAAHGGSLSSESSHEYFRSVAAMGIQAAMALQHAHDQGVIHRDIKPSNLLLDGHAKLFIADFGLARMESNDGLTMSGNLLGTLRYMPPEQASGDSHSIDERADIYSLAATLYELVALRPMFSAASHQPLLKQIALEEPIPLRRIDKKVPRDLETIIHKSLSKESSERYQTAQALADDLRAFVEYRSIAARRPTWTQRVAKWTRRNTTLAWTMIVSLLLISLTLAASTFYVARIARQLAVSVSVHELVSAYRAWSQYNLSQTQQTLARLSPNHHGVEYDILGTLCDRAHGRVVAQTDGRWCLSTDETMMARFRHGTVVVTRVNDGAEVTSIPVATEPQCLALEASARRLAIGSGDWLRSNDDPESGDGLRLVSLDTQAPNHVSSANTHSCCFSPDGSWVAAITVRAELQIWNAEDGSLKWAGPIYEKLEPKRPELNMPEYCGFTDDSRHVITVFRRLHQGVKMWTLDGEPVDVPDVDTLSPNIHGAAVLDDHSIVLAGLHGLHRFCLDESTSGSKLPTELPDCDRVSKLALTADRSRLAVLTGRAVEVWDLTPRRRIWRRFPEGRVRAVKFIGNDRIAIASEGNIEEFPLDQAFFTPRFVDVRLTWPCQPSVQQNQLVLPGPSDDLIMWDLTEGQSRHFPLELRQADGTRSKLGPPMVICMAPDGARIATVHLDSERTIRVWDVATGQHVQSIEPRIEPQEGQILALTYTHSGRVLAVGAGISLVMLDAATGDERWRNEDGDRPISKLAVSPDGATLATGEWGGRVSTWSLSGPAPVLQQEFTLDQNILALSVSPDSRWLVAADWLGNLRAAELHDVSRFFDLPGHSQAVTKIAFSPDGKTMLSGGEDGLIKFWRVESWRDTGELVFDGHVRSVDFLSKRNGDRALVIGTDDGRGIHGPGAQVSLLMIRPPTEWSWPRTVTQDAW